MLKIDHGTVKYLIWDLLPNEQKVRKVRKWGLVICRQNNTPHLRSASGSSSDFFLERILVAIIKAINMLYPDTYTHQKSFTFYWIENPLRTFFTLYFCTNVGKKYAFGMRSFVFWWFWQSFVVGYLVWFYTIFVSIRYYGIPDWRRAQLFSKWSGRLLSNAYWKITVQINTCWATERERERVQCASLQFLWDLSIAL